MDYLNDRSGDVEVTRVIQLSDGSVSFEKTVIVDVDSLDVLSIDPSGMLCILEYGGRRSMVPYMGWRIL